MRQQQRRNGPQRGESIRVSVSLSFTEAAFGCEKELTVERMEQCTTCKGSGCAPGTTPEVCPECHGSGVVQTRRQTPMGVFASSNPCRKCGGTGRIIHQPCPKCGGEMYQRDDDKPETIKNRLDVYEKSTSPLVDYYRGQGLLKSVNGDQARETVYGDVKEALGL